MPDLSPFVQVLVPQNSLYIRGWCFFATPVTFDQLTALNLGLMFIGVIAYQYQLSLISYTLCFHNVGVSEWDNFFGRVLKFLYQWDSFNKSLRSVTYGLPFQDADIVRASDPHHDEMVGQETVKERLARWDLLPCVTSTTWISYLSGFWEIAWKVCDFNIILCMLLCVLACIIDWYNLNWQTWLWSDWHIFLLWFEKFDIFNS